MTVNSPKFVEWSGQVIILLALTLLALVNNYFFGADLSSDTLNYHVYAGFSALNDRFAYDYFAAGPQAYFNPYVYAPLYALMQTKLSALAISTILGLVHCISLWLTFELAVVVCPSHVPRTRLIYGGCAAGLALLNPIFLQQVGSSYADVTTADLCLSGWLLLASAVLRPSVARVVAAGLLLGVATALKLTNAVHAVAGIVVLAMAPLSWRNRARLGGYYFVSGMLAAAVAAAPWAYKLYNMFGNPFFPLMNSLFRSPEFTTGPLVNFRFIPGSLAEALWRPFSIVKPVRMVHEELRSPDIRYAALAVLAITASLVSMWQRWRRTANQPTVALDSSVAAGSVLVALGAAFAVDWTLWLKASGNGRYFLPMASVAAVLVVALLAQIFSSRPKIRNYLLMALFGSQFIQLALGTDFRWDSRVAWHDRWLDVQVPTKLKMEPNLYLTMGVESNSYLAPYLAKGSGLVNISGQFAFDLDSANGRRTDALIHRYSTHVRLLIEAGSPRDVKPWLQVSRAPLDDVLARFGLHVDESDCETIVAHQMPLSVKVDYSATHTPAEPPRDFRTYMTCHVLPGGIDRRTQRNLKKVVDQALDRVEDACPQLFQPKRPYTEMVAKTGTRRYLNTDFIAWVREDTIRVFNPMTGDPVYVLGAASSWAAASHALICGRLNKHYFVRVSDSVVKP